MTFGRITALLGGALFAIGCGSNAVEVCPADLRYAFSPRDTTIAVGTQFTASLSLYGCGGRERLADTITFASSDAAVAVVGVNTGLVTGIHPGDAVITASAQHNHIDVPIHVTVR